jgi:hypothetical protein
MPSLFLPFFNYNGKSVLVEDSMDNIGLDIKNGISLVKPTGHNPGNPVVTLRNLPTGTIVSWTSAPTGPTTTKTIQTTSDSITLLTYAELVTVSLQAPPQSDADFNMLVTLTTPGSYANNVSTFSHPVKVLAVADKPQVVATTSLDVLETGKVPLDVKVIRSTDRDGSESLVVRFKVNPMQGILHSVSSEVVTFTPDTTTGQYTLIATGTNGGGDPALQQAALNAHFATGSVKFVPTYGFGGQANVTVEVISVELATGADLAPSTLADPDTKMESTFTVYVFPKKVFRGHLFPCLVQLTLCMFSLSCCSSSLT